VDEPLPVFRYHPDPVGTGSVVESDGTCRACGRARGFLYTGPVYAVDELDDALCPWCIADGRAAATFDADFTDVGADVPPDVPGPVIETVAHRTPGYLAWQQDSWRFHCGDACAFLGPVGAVELGSLPPGARSAVVASAREPGGTEAGAEAFVDALARDGGPTAYLFRCLHCGAFTAACDGP